MGTVLRHARAGHGGDVGVRTRSPVTIRCSVLRVFGPATPTRVTDEAESHLKTALDTRTQGLNRI